MKGLVERPLILRLEVREGDDQAGRRVQGGEVKAVTLHP